MISDDYFCRTTTQQLVYTAAALQISSGCTMGDLAINPSGVVAFPPTYCNGRPIRRGSVDGASLTTMYTPTTYSPIREDFTCMGRDPAGGFYFLAVDTLGANPRLYRAGESANGLTALELVPTEPSLGEVRVSRGTGVSGGSPLFGSCTMAVASNGDIIQTLKDAWRIKR